MIFIRDNHDVLRAFDFPRMGHNGAERAARSPICAQATVLRGSKLLEVVPHMNRRQLAKGVAAGIASGLPPANTLRASTSASEGQLEWRSVHPGVWRARLGT